MTATLKILPSADRDIDDQAGYIAVHEDLETAAAFYRAADETFEQLTKSPRIGRNSDYELPQLRGTRVFPMRHFTKHLIFYRVNQNEIEIVCIFHGARDLGNLIEE
jgi:toxin ParE1/3/4